MRCTVREGSDIDNLAPLPPLGLPDDAAACGRFATDVVAAGESWIGGIRTEGSQEWLMPTCSKHLHGWVLYLGGVDNGRYRILPPHVIEEAPI